MESYRFESKDRILEDLRKVAAEFGHVRDYTYRLGLRLLMHSKEAPLPCRETPAELEAVTSQFSAQIHALFDALHAFEESPDVEGGGGGGDGVEDLAINIEPQSFDRYLDCLHRNHHSHRLTLKDPHTLPQLSCVTKFRAESTPNYGSDFSTADIRPLSLRLLLECIVHLPALEEIDFPWLWEYMPVATPAPTFRHYTRPWEGPWRDSRHEFGKAVELLRGQIPTSLKRARLWFWQVDVFMSVEDQSVPLPNLVHPAEADPVSLGLRTLASLLEELKLRAFITPDLFKAPILWSRMRRLRVEFHPWRPDGQWYFVGPDGKDTPAGFEVLDEHYPPIEPSAVDEEVDDKYADDFFDYYEPDLRHPNMFRTEPAAARIDPLLSAFASALKGMPVLEEAELFTYLASTVAEEVAAEDGNEGSPAEVGNIHRWGVRYVPGSKGVKGLVEWQVGDWRPREDVLTLFEDLDGQNSIEMAWKSFQAVEERDHDTQGYARLTWNTEA